VGSTALIRRVLVGLGGSPFSRTATRHAVGLATAHGAEVTGVTLMDPAGFDGTGFHLTGAATCSGSPAIRWT
jgi:nucleotide-binding universal stress UspA family protein